MPMKAGKLRKKLFLLQRSASVDTYGAETEIYTSLGRFWGSVEPLSTKEKFNAGTTIGEETHRVRIRYRDNVVGSFRVLFENEFDTLNGAINDSTTTVEVSSGVKIGDQGDYYARIEEEVVQVTAGQGTTTLTVGRDKFSTGAATHATTTKMFKLTPMDIVGPPINHRERNESLEFMCVESTSSF